MCIPEFLAMAGNRITCAAVLINKDLVSLFGSPIVLSF